MSLILREYLLKGLFVGLWAYLALTQPAGGIDWPRFGRVCGWMTGGLALGLLVGAAVQMRKGMRPSANWVAFPLAVLFESPLWVYVGVVGGLGLGAFFEFDPRADRNWLGYCCVGGLLLGYGFHQLRQIPNWLWRFALSLGVGAALVYLAVTYIDQLPGLNSPDDRRALGLTILLGLPFFYLLTFCGEAEESEIEIAALCAGLGIGLDLLGLSSSTNFLGAKVVFLLPIALYVTYAIRVLPGLRVFKHVLRGYSALTANRLPDALLSFKRALRLNPASELAAEGMWAVHQRVDVTRLPADSPLLQHLDYGFCLDQASAALLGNRTPTPGDRDKAARMLELVARQQPALAARVDYLRAVLATHAKQFDAAAGTLAQLLDPTSPYEQTARRPVLLAAWELALRLHPEITKRVGPAELDKPGRRMEAVGAVERALAAKPNDPGLLTFRDELYAGLSEAEFTADAASGLPADFNFEYVEQLGLALADQPDHRDRGMAYLRMAGRGLPARGPGLFGRLADLAAAAGRPDEARGYREQVKRAGLAVGLKGLPADQRKVYLTTVKALADEAEARGDLEAAVADTRLYLEGGTAELESYRKLADLHEKMDDMLNALLMTETALAYSGKDKDLLARKDRCYAFVKPERVAAVKDRVARWFDVDYCATKAKSVLDAREADADALAWALHLVRLAKLVKPTLAAAVAEARILLRTGERDAALQILEDVREAKPSGSAESDAWYAAVKLLGDLYLNEMDRPDLAIGCYTAYRDYAKSGADTLFQIARGYEATGDAANAARYYEAVTAYEQHPKYWEAKEALGRLKGG